jgi:SAM-dependent methyltransferase
VTGHDCHPAHARGSHEVFRDERFAAALEIEGELAAGLDRHALDACQAQRAEVGAMEVTRVADVGCGPGVTTSLLARAFPAATIVGVDGSPVMLHRARERAVRSGVAERVEFHEMDLDGEIASLGAFDLIWVAMALHHAADPSAALRRLAAQLRPRGLLCLLEFAAPMVVRAGNELGRPGLWDRVASAQQGARSALPGPGHGSDYAGLIEATGLHMLDRRTLSDTVIAAECDAVPLLTRYLGSVAGRANGALGASDRDAITSALSHAADTEWGEVSVSLSRSMSLAHAGASDTEPSVEVA